MSQDQAEAPVRRATYTEVFIIKAGCAGIAGVIGAGTFFPLDLAKTLLQKQNIAYLRGEVSPTKYRGVVDCIRQQYAKGGVRSLYQGLKPNLIGIVPEKGVKLAVNDAMRDLLKDSDGHVSLYNGCIAGAVTGLFQSVVTNPMELIKIRFQAADPGVKPDPLFDRGVATGIRRVYKGWHTTIMRDIPFNIIFFSIYGYMGDNWAKDASGEPILWRNFVAGMTAGVVGSVLSTPLDVVKTLVQLESGKTSVTDVVSNLYKKGGVRCFFLGAGPRAAAIGPLFALALLSYEFQKHLMVKFGIVH